MWHVDVSDLWTDMTKWKHIELVNLCQKPLYDASVAAWYLATVLFRSLTYPLPLDSSCLPFYVTSSILAVKSQSVATFTMNRGSLPIRLDLWNDLLIIIMEGICSLRQVLLNVLSTKWTCAIMSGVRWANLTLCDSAALWLACFFLSLLCRHLQMKVVSVVSFNNEAIATCCLLQLRDTVTDIKHQMQFGDCSWVIVLTVKESMYILLGDI